MYCIVLYCIVLYCIVLYCIVLYCIVLYCIVLYCIVLYCIVLYCIVLYCIVLYCIVLYAKLTPLQKTSSIVTNAASLGVVNPTAMSSSSSRIETQYVSVQIYHDLHFIYLELHFDITVANSYYIHYFNYVLHSLINLHLHLLIRGTMFTVGGYVKHHISLLKT